MDLEIVKGFEQYVTNKREHLGGTAITFKFENGRGASVVKNNYSYGGDKGFWELAVLDKEGRLDYTTEITDDVIGWLDVVNAQYKLKRIQALGSDSNE